MAFGRLFGVAGTALLLLGATAATASTPPKGARIVSVRAVPIATQRGAGVLSRRRLNTVTASTALGFRVKIHNSAAVEAKGESVSLIISRPTGGATLIAKLLPAIAAGRTRTLTFSNLGAVPFATRTQITVSLRSGATSTFPVIFSLPSGNSAGIAAPADPFRITIPDLIGTAQSPAIAWLESHGLEILVQPVSSSQPVGRVVAEAPAPGTRISRGSIVKLTVSS